MKDNLSEHFEKQLERTNTWLSFAEAKNAALIAFNVAMTGVLSDVLSEYMPILVFLLTLLLISTIAALFSFMPNLGNRPSPKSKEQKANNLLFFGDIARCRDERDLIEKTKERYFPEMEESADKKNINIDLASEILINSRLAVRKYSLFKTALLFDFFCLVVAAVSFIVA